MLRNVPAPMCIKDSRQSGCAGSQKAQGIVEFALILPVLLLLVWGVIEVGRMLFIYSAVHTASREAARYGSAIGADGPNGPRYRDCSGMREAATRLGSLAGITAGDVAISYDNGPTPPSTTPICPPGTSTAPAYVVNGGVTRIVVEVNSDYKPIVPLVRLPDFTITSRSVRTIIKDIKIGGVVSATEPPATVPPSISTIHVAGMNGTSSWDDASKKTWSATITVTVHDDTHSLLSDAVVSGTWNGGVTGSLTCKTQTDGTCSVTASGINKKTATFTVTGIVLTGYSYANTDNHNPSNATFSVNEP